MMDLDRRYGFCTARVWGLILNLMGNTLALYGLVGFLRDGTHLLPLVLGALITVVCVLVLATPSR